MSNFRLPHFQELQRKTTQNSVAYTATPAAAVMTKDTKSIGPFYMSVSAVGGAKIIRTPKPSFGSNKHPHIRNALLQRLANARVPLIFPPARLAAARLRWAAAPRMTGKHLPRSLF